MKFYHYWRSSAAYRVRLGLSLKGLDAEAIPVDLRAGEQSEAAYKKVNPAALVPSLDLGTEVLRQSMAILEYLDEVYPTPPLLPSEPLERARVRALCQDVACDIHPLNNLRVLNRLRAEFQADEAAISDWYRHWIVTGLNALEVQAAEYGSGQWLYRDQLTLADVLLIPQLYNALRYDLPLDSWPRLQRIYDQATAREEFARAAPENNQPED